MVRRFLAAGVLWTTVLGSVQPLAAASGLPAPAPKALATCRGVGSILAAIVGPGRKPGQELLYLSYTYADAMDVVAVEVDTRAFQVLANPVPSEVAAHAMVAGPDGRIYLGTAPHGHLLALDGRIGTMTDLGRPSPNAQYIWHLAVGSDGRVYGATYPAAELVRYDPSNGKMENLGRMDPREEYARFLAADNDGYVYVGVGPAKGNVVAYEIRTGVHRPLLPPEFQVQGNPLVFRSEEGRCYAKIERKYFRLAGRLAERVVSGEVPTEPAGTVFRDGRYVRAEGNTLRITDRAGGRTVTRSFAYGGRDMDVFRLAVGPDGMIYASTAMPAHLMQIGPGGGKATDLGLVGGGEVYSFLAEGRQLLMAGYCTDAPLMSYDPSRPWAPGAGRDANPMRVSPPGLDPAWRPTAMVPAAPGHAWVGGVGGYGKLGGPLCLWGFARDEFTSYTDVKDQAIMSLAVAGNLLVGGTTAEGGPGSHPTQTEARLFLWSPPNGRKLLDLVPVRGAYRISNLVAAAGRIFGIAEGSQGTTLFVLDPQAGAAARTTAVGWGRCVNGGAALGGDGRIWGLSQIGVFAIDPRTERGEIAWRLPDSLSGRVAGFALDGNCLYYACGPTVYRFELPKEPRVDGPGSFLFRPGHSGRPGSDLPCPLVVAASSPSRHLAGPEYLPLLPVEYSSGNMRGACEAGEYDWRGPNCPFVPYQPISQR